MIGYLLLALTIVLLSLTAWLATWAYEIGLPLGKRRGGQLIAATFAALSVLAVAGWVNKVPQIALTAEAHAGYVAHDVSQFYHTPGCRYATRAKPVEQVAWRRPCPYCLAEEGGDKRTAHRPDSKPEGNPADARQNVLSLIHEPAP